MSDDRLKNALYMGSYGYLMLPYLVFFGGWVRQPYSTLLILLLLFGSVASFRVARPSGRTEGVTAGKISVAGVALLLTPVLVVTLIAGAG